MRKKYEMRKAALLTPNGNCLWPLKADTEPSSFEKEVPSHGQAKHIQWETVASSRRGGAFDDNNVAMTAGTATLARVVACGGEKDARYILLCSVTCISLIHVAHDRLTSMASFAAEVGHHRWHGECLKQRRFL